MSEHAYYNDNDRHSAAWLRELIKAGLISPGSVDERSIKDVRGSDVEGYNRVHFFAGIGGWDYALKLAGWPSDRDVWTGSCPCQPLSGAGKRKGEKDERHLWPEFYRLISECKPSTVFGEQVASRDGREWLAGVRADLEALGYAVGVADLCAAGETAPHIRQRLYWVADRQGGNGGLPVHQRGSRQEGIESVGSGKAGGLDNTIGTGSLKQEYQEPSESCRNWANDGISRASSYWSAFQLVHCRDGKARRIEPGTWPLVDGLPGRVGLLRGYGNAIVPQVAAKFIRAFMSTSPQSG